MLVSEYRRLLLSRQPLEEDTPCGYCRLPFGRNGLGEYGFGVDHIKPKSRHPELVMEISNLTWACGRCNRKKSNYVEGFDPKSRAFYTLFNPNEEPWVRHFSGRPDGKIHGVTTTGRATGERLRLNVESLLLELRSEGYAAGWWPARIRRARS